MNNIDKIINLFYEQKFNIIVISSEIGVTKQYVSKIVKTDSRYMQEKKRRKEENARKQRDRNIQCIKKKRKRKQDNDKRIDSILKLQHLQASHELSGGKSINNQAFRKWNSSIYNFNDKTKEYRLREEFKNKTSYAIPKKIKWD